MDIKIKYRKINLYINSTYIKNEILSHKVYVYIAVDVLNIKHEPYVKA